MDDSIRIVIIVVCVLVLFLLVRAFWWWYFGIDRIIEALESMDASLKQLPAVQRADRARLHQS